MLADELTVPEYDDTRGGEDGGFDDERIQKREKTARWAKIPTTAGWSVREGVKFSHFSNDRVPPIPRERLACKLLQGRDPNCDVQRSRGNMGREQKLLIKPGTND